MKIRHLVAASLLALCSGLAQANAVYNVPAPLDPGDVYNNNAFVTGIFTDTYNFSVDESVASLWATVVIPTFNPVNGQLVQSIDNLAVALFDSGNALLDSGPFGYYSLGAGAYYFEVSGEAVGGMQGNYQFQLAAETVPEPASLGLILLGSGLLALGRRRKPLPAGPASTAGCGAD